MSEEQVSYLNCESVKKNSGEQLSEHAHLVKAALLTAGLETPMLENQQSDSQKYQKIKAHFTEIVSLLGLDLNDDSLAETPHRIAKMYVNEIFSGLNYQHFPSISLIENKMATEEMVKVDKISLTSTCEHHFVTIDGFAKVAYIPNKTLIGLSKINRIVSFFAQRPQIQERLTQQVLVALQALLNTDDVAVTINATHYCVKARGVMDSNSSTTTTALGGSFKSNANTRLEFLQ